MLAHRLKTVRNADQILVLDNAHIVQRGTHAELIQQKGLNADIVKASNEAIGWKLPQVQIFPEFPTGAAFLKDSIY